MKTWDGSPKGPERREVAKMVVAAGVVAQTFSWILLVSGLPSTAAWASRAAARRSGRTSFPLAQLNSAVDDAAFAQGDGNVLVLDHFNVNHEAGRHDLLKAFYFDVLGLAVDPRKADNLDKGRKTLWANAGAHQFHLPENDQAQVFDGSITLAYEPDAFAALLFRLRDPPAVLANSQFSVSITSESPQAVAVKDPWGNHFELLQRVGPLEPRGVQPGASSESTGLLDLTVHVPSRGSIAGIGRFYRQVLGCRVQHESATKLVLQVGPAQTLTFELQNRNLAHEEVVNLDEGPANLGPHVSMYVRDLKETFKRADELGVVFVNHRFNRRAYTEEEAVDQCMFRVLDVVDPTDRAAGPIVRLEHEIRSTVKRDGGMYESSPFFEIPDGVVRP